MQEDYCQERVSLKRDNCCQGRASPRTDYRQVSFITGCHQAGGTLSLCKSLRRREDCYQARKRALLSK